MKRVSRSRRAVCYLLPWLIGFAVFRAAPMLWSLWCGFTDFHLFRGVTQTGLMNYISLLTDKTVLASVGRTLLFACISVPLKLTAAMAAALLLSRQMRGINLFRTLYYLPSILGGSVAAAVLWKAMFRDNGCVNALLTAAGLPAVSWFGGQGTAMWVMILLRVWEFGAPMLLFLAALRAIPQDMLDAADIDGAGGIRKFFLLKLPMISPVVFYNLMLSFCAALQEFNAPFVITEGGPRGATALISLLLYRSAFTANEMGYASAMAWLLFVLSAMCAGLFLIFRRRLVYLPEEESGASA